MIITKLIEKLEQMREKHGDIECVFFEGYAEYYYLVDDDNVSYHAEVVPVDKNEDIVPGFEDGKPAIIIGMSA